MSETDHTNAVQSATDVDPIDEEAAHIDARSPDAPEQIAELVEHAEDLGRSTDTA